MSIKLQSTLIKEIKDIIIQARAKAVSTVNTAMVEAYWQMGKRIVEEEQQGEQRASYGEAVIKQLSKALVLEFGKGFSVANLKNFRKFYQTFPDFEKSYTLCSLLSWSHYRLIMRLENADIRQYYIQECTRQHWSVRSLECNIHSGYYQRILSSQVPATTAVSTESTVHDFIKDPYVFEFLNLTEPEKAHEKDLETALINHLQKFLLELGKGFSFVGRQFRISTETSHFYIDLVFYNYILKCFVLFDLKTTKLKHQDIGQMDMYIRMFDDLQKQADDNPTIGIILCADKEETVVKYSAIDGSDQLFASQYQLYLPSEEELVALLDQDRMLFDLDADNE
ncbi:MAG: PDDEXK nuclease domain-containing protein [Ghiorsea sp.]|nr:PDDEXK nuclease domain-containing protein [Ghiorsea sp.]